ncbi:hypothetical protein B4135_1763 [Caldibacillus debilis]|uniref:Uncharacterized protein n=1 Tax=Caldibacillus debilis TaxID=301148 RepID=A0A150M960_9BACI|nr:hypothetical protein B4135_1763 [Caldibacillus debilis]
MYIYFVAFNFTMNRKIFYSYNFKNVLTGNRLHFIILIS